MIVGKDHAMRRKVEGTAQQTPQIGFDMPACSFCQYFVAKIPPVIGHEGCVQAFGGRFSDTRAKIGAERGIADRNRCATYLLEQPAGDECARCGDDVDEVAVPPEGEVELFAGRCDRAAETSEMRDQLAGRRLGSVAREGFEEARHDR